MSSRVPGGAFLRSPPAAWGGIQPPRCWSADSRREETNAVNIQLEPCLWDRNVFRPRLFTKTGVRRLEERPQGEGLGALKSFRMKILATLLHERNAQDFAVGRRT